MLMHIENLNERFMILSEEDESGRVTVTTDEEERVLRGG